MTGRPDAKFGKTALDCDLLGRAKQEPDVPLPAILHTHVFGVCADRETAPTG